MFKRPYYVIYVCLFASSCYVVFQTLESTITKIEPDPIISAFTRVLVLAAMAHIFLVYFSMHNIEENESEWAGVYNGFIGGGIELSIRWFIVFCLIIFSGKVLADYVQPAQAGILLMGSLMAWDIASCYFATNKTWRDVFNPKIINGQFFWSDCIGLLVWIAVYSSDPNVIKIITIAGTVIYVSIIIWRIYQLFANKGALIPSE